MEKIPISLIMQIDKKIIEIFDAEDEDYPDRRIITSKERAIRNRLKKITDDKEEQNKIYEAIEKGFLATTYKPICDNLRALGYTILEGE